MAVMRSKDGKNLVITCRCGCDDGIRIQIVKDDYTFLQDYAWMTYLSGNFYKEQATTLSMWKEKLKKIWAIIRSKDYYYSDIILNAEDFAELKEYINSIE